MVVIHQVLNGNNDPTSTMQLQALNPQVKHWEELIGLIKKIVARKNHTV
jgi:hypothetical protein